MDLQINVSDIWAPAINSEDLPDAIVRGLQTIEAAKLKRAKAEVADRLELILKRVHIAVERLRLAAIEDAQEEADRKAEQGDHDDGDDDGPLDFQVIKSRQALARTIIQAFFFSSFEKKDNLSSVLGWLKETDKVLVEAQPPDCVSQEWVDEMEDKISESLLDTECSIQRLYHLCQRILADNSQKSRNAKEKNYVGKDGVWRWWRVPRADVKTILRIQKQSPPTVDQLLADDGSHATVDSAAGALCYMLTDMEKFFNCKKTMSMAFDYAQTGLLNTCKALVTCKQELADLREQVEQLRALSAEAAAEAKANAEAVAAAEAAAEAAAVELQAVTFVDTSEQLYITRLKKDLSSSKRSISQMKLQITDLERDKAALSEELKKAQEAAATAVSGLLTAVATPEPPEEVRPRSAMSTWRSRTSALHPPTSAVSDKSWKETETENEEEKEEEEEELKRLISVDDEEGAAPSPAPMVIKIKHSRSEPIPAVTSTSMQSLATEVTAAAALKARADTPVDSLSTRVLPKSVSMYEPYFETMSERPISAMSAPRPFSATAAPRPISRVSVSRPVSAKSAPEAGTSLDEVQPGHHSRAFDSSPDTDTTKTAISAPRCNTAVTESYMERSSESYGERASALRRMAERGPMRTASQAAPTMFRQALPGDPTDIQSSTVAEDLELDFNIGLAMDAGDSMKKEMADGSYCLSAHAQRINLRLLQQAAQGKHISLRLHVMAKDVTRQFLYAADLRLSCLMRKYIAYQALLKVRHNINLQMATARKFKDGGALKDGYVFMSNLEAYERQVLRRFTLRRAAAAEDRLSYLSTATWLFKKIRDEFGVRLILPYPRSSSCLGPCSLLVASQSPTLEPKPGPPTLRVRRPRPPTAPARMQRGCREEETIQHFILCNPNPSLSQSPVPHYGHLWDVQSTLYDMEVARKTPAPKGTVPTLPRLLEMDISQGRSRALHAAQCRVVPSRPSRSEERCGRARHF